MKYIVVVLRQTMDCIGYFQVVGQILWMTFWREDVVQPTDLDIVKLKTDL